MFSQGRRRPAIPAMLRTLRVPIIRRTFRFGLPHDCGTCHSTSNWLNASFDHTLYAHYPLTGKHATVTCAQCHANNSYVATPTACYACHKADFDGATKSKSRGFRLPYRLQHVPHDLGLDNVHLQPRIGFPADRGTCHCFPAPSATQQ